MGTPPSPGQGPCLLLPAVPSPWLAPSRMLRVVTDRSLYRQALPTCTVYSQLSDIDGI